MDFRMSDDRRMLADTLGRFVQEKYPIEKRHEIAASDDGYSAAIWRELADLGAIGAMFREELGGFGGTGADLSVLFEQLGRGLVVEPFLPNLVAGVTIAELDANLAAELLDGVIAGSHRLALAHGEPDARYDLGWVRCSASKGGDGYLLQGRKSVVLGGGAADRMVVTARVEGKDNSDGVFSAFLVPADADGVSLRKYSTVDGYPAAEIVLENVSGELLGPVGGAMAAIEKAAASAIVALCAESLGACEVAKDLTVEYMHTRKQFGVPIGKFQALQHRMADVLIEIEQLRSATINAAGFLDADPVIRDRHGSAAKNLAGRVGRQVAEEAIQIHGGMGMTWEYPVGHYAKRIVMIDHLFGDADHHLQKFISLGKMNA